MRGRRSKTIIITGATEGIGAAAAIALQDRGHHIVITGPPEHRSAARAEGLHAEFLVVDFTRLADVREAATILAAAHPQIDVLANNAGGMFGDRSRTVDGFETTLQVNHLAPFLLTNLLLPHLLASHASVIQTSSEAERLNGRMKPEDWGGHPSASSESGRLGYHDPRLVNILFAKELHFRFHSAGLSSAALHAGSIATSFASRTTNVVGRFLDGSQVARRLLDGSDNGPGQLVWLAEGTPGIDWESGEYYERFEPATKPYLQALAPLLAKPWWDATSRLLDLDPR